MSNTLSWCKHKNETENNSSNRKFQVKQVNRQNENQKNIYSIAIQSETM